jgi:hypothetical protein
LSSKGLVGFRDAPQNLHLRLVTVDLGSKIEDKWNPTTTTTRKITVA